MKVGVHLRNADTLTEGDSEKIREAQVSGALVMWYHRPQDVINAGLNPADCVVRLQDSVYKKWPSGEKYIPSWQDYANDLKATIRAFYAHGFRRFQPDCEPDLSWPDAGYVPPENHTVQGDWAWFMGNSLFHLEHGVRYGVPGDVELGMTPFSCPMPHEWYEASWVWQQEGTSKPLVLLFEFLCAHCYWQAEEDMYSLTFGRNYLDVLSSTNYTRPVWITEVGNSSSASDAHQRRVAQYPYYPLMAASDPYALEKVQGVYFYILGSEGWPLFELDDEICRAIGARPKESITLDISSGGGGGRVL